jgi:hypothetical protein
LQSLQRILQGSVAVQVFSFEPVWNLFFIFLVYRVNLLMLCIVFLFVIVQFWFPFTLPVLNSGFFLEVQQCMSIQVQPSSYQNQDLHSLICDWTHSHRNQC